MAFDWNDYLIVATKLKGATLGKANTSGIEALQRSAISRAYYSMYHLATDYAKNNLGYKITRDEKSKHKAIIDLYSGRTENTEYQNVGLVLNRLRKNRTDSDYESKNLGNMQNLLESVLLGASEIKDILVRR